MGFKFGIRNSKSFKFLRSFSYLEKLKKDVALIQFEYL